MLFQHFQKELGNKAVTNDTLDIRLLTDPKTKKSRGMAFVETKDPELLYECLKLHHTHIDGRRINVERSAGGKKSSEARQSKIKEYRKEQTEYMSKTVDTILEDYKKSGDLNEDELDDGVIALCKRHSAATVTNALSEYVEARGSQMQNPSAYLTHMIGRVAVEGPTEEPKEDWKKKRPTGNSSGGARTKKVDGGKKSSAPTRNSVKTASIMSNVDMSNSIPSGESKMSTIFPSMSRGRGRGRGYM
jgi:RNA recognition motif-containing protein